MNNPTSENSLDQPSEPSELKLSDLLSKDPDPVQSGVLLKQLAEDESVTSNLLLSELTDAQDQFMDADPAVVGGLLRLLHVKALSGGRDTIERLQPQWLGVVLRALSPEVANRHLLLQLLAMIRTVDSLTLLVELLGESPPRGWMAAAQILSPLMQHDDWEVSAVFPNLLDSLGEPALASPVLDLAGHLVRSGRLKTHPASERIGALDVLLNQVADRLGKFEEEPRSFGTDVQEVQAILGEAVAIAVSLCDAVGLIGDARVSGGLHKAMGLRHRRVQCEAAGALARLGESVGNETLLELAAEPSARLRAIAYAEELGFGDDVDPKYNTPSAIAEAEMALWLSQPQQMGVPPTGVEVVDSRRMLWPSFENPVDVFLIRFDYNFGDRAYSNIGMTGPAVFAISADLADMPLEDVYAIYAGWHAEHDEIFTIKSSQFNEPQLRLTEPLKTYLERSGYEEVTVKLLGFFLDETAAVFEAKRDGTSCCVVTDGLETIDLPTAGRQRPPTVDDLFYLYKGRKMLRTFNPQGI